MLTAADIMTRDVVTIRGSATVAEAVAALRKNELRALIVDRRNPQDSYAILTETDIVYKVIAYGIDAATIRVFEIMTKPCIGVRPDLGVEYIARLFANTGIRRAPVIGDRLLGIVSVSDILHRGDAIEKPKSRILQEEITQAIVYARDVSAKQGLRSAAAAEAWDEVEELQAAAAHQQAQKLPKTAFEEYCESHPDADEARVYDV